MSVCAILKNTDLCEKNIIFCENENFAQKISDVHEEHASEVAHGAVFFLLTKTVGQWCMGN
jgi:hypothetical protein